MTQAIVLRETGGPQKLQYETVEVGEPGPDTLLPARRALHLPDSAMRLPRA